MRDSARDGLLCCANLAKTLATRPKHRKHRHGSQWGFCKSTCKSRTRRDGRRDGRAPHDNRAQASDQISLGGHTAKRACNLCVALRVCCSLAQVGVLRPHHLTSLSRQGLDSVSVATSWLCRLGIRSAYDDGLQTLHCCCCCCFATAAITHACTRSTAQGFLCDGDWSPATKHTLRHLRLHLRMYTRQSLSVTLQVM